MDDKNDNSNVLQYLNNAFVKYNDSFSAQFHLKIPKNTIKTVDYYRDTFFPYLKDSVYKSNICYLLQSIDYQLWLYKIFRPALSLENAVFYQQLVVIGIATEAITTALLLDPFITHDSKDRSLGGVIAEFQDVQSFITRNPFSNNIRLLEKSNSLPESFTQRLQEIRIDIRNQVHIQNWEGRLYQTLDYDRFSGQLTQFRELLYEIKDNVQIPGDAHKAAYLLGFGESKDRKGKITNYKVSGGFGFIFCPENQSEYYFHISNVHQPQKGQSLALKAGMPVEFDIQKGPKGPEGVNIRLKPHTHKKKNTKEKS